MSGSGSNRRLTLVRHAKSCWRYSGLDDHDRPLSRRGLKDCRKVPLHLASLIDPPDRVLTSDAVRAVQTCEAVVAEVGVGEGGVDLVANLYLASPGGILAIIAGVPDEVHHLMLVGHNPGMTELYQHLSGEALDNLPTLGVAHLEFQEAGSWSDLEAGGGRVVELILPREI